MTAWGGPGPQPGDFSAPTGVAVDGAGRVYVATARRVLVFSDAGVFLAAWDGPGGAADAFGALGGVAVDEQGAIYVADQVPARVLKFRPRGPWPTPAAARPTPRPATPTATPATARAAADAGPDDAHRPLTGPSPPRPGPSAVLARRPTRSVRLSRHSSAGPDPVWRGQRDGEALPPRLAPGAAPTAGFTSHRPMPRSHRQHTGRPDGGPALAERRALNDGGEVAGETPAARPSTPTLAGRSHRNLTAISPASVRSRRRRRRARVRSGCAGAQPRR